MKTESKQMPRSNTDKSSVSCYDFTKLSEALESAGADSLVATTVQSDGKSLYEFKEISEALNCVEKSHKRRLQAKRRKLKRMRQKQRKDQVFEDLEKLDQLYTILSVVY